ncbi:MAG: xanthine dehydrogenase family protein subunit M, partial [Anaerolineales bacterium]|nr:xanthine dehydrogenase family protein subunit M [Anaerolineales bacterium]
MRPFEYHEPTSIEAASELLARHGPDAAALAGGTALLIDMRHGELQPRHVVSLWKIPGLGKFHANGGLTIGPLLTVTELGDAMREPATFGLREAARMLGSWQVQNMATVGGNICKASPGADLVPPLLCLDARLSLRSAGGEREVPLDGFLTGPDQTALRPGELLVDILVPQPAPRTGTAFLKIMRRQALDCSIVSVCARVTLEDDGLTCKDARIGLAAVAPNPIRARRAEAALAGRKLDPETTRHAAELARSEARPITDVRATAEYRRLLVGVLVERALGVAAERARKGE